MGKGYIKLNREIQDSWLWNEKPFSRAQAWIDLLLLANYKDTKEVYRGQLVHRKRGQVACGMQYLADKWGWSRGKVKRFMAILEQDNMVTINSTTGGTTITIENYAKWQDWRPTDSTTNDTTDGTTDEHQTVQQTDIQKKVKESKKNSKKNSKEERAPQTKQEAIDAFMRAWANRTERSSNEYS